MAVATIRDFVYALLSPFMLMGLSLSFLPSTIIELGKSSPAKLKSWSDIKDAWHARFWTHFGPQAKTFSAPTVVPLLTHATGNVLDIGSGQGHFLSLYPKDQITKIYAVEPNKSHHAKLLASAEAAGLLENGQFEIVNAHIESLSNAGVQKGSIDTICTLQTLCSIDNPEVLIPELRTYLKKDGGKWIVHEHVRRPEHNGFVVLYQRALNVIWRECLNGCNLTRRTKEWIEDTGGWRTAVPTSGEGQLTYREGNGRYTLTPFVHGVLVSE